MPFDLSFSTIDALVHFLKTDFEDLFDDVSYDDKRNYYMNYKNYMVFNHDIDCENTEEGYEKLKIRYKNRIQNFRDCLKSNEHLFFIYNNFHLNNEQKINDLFSIISGKRLNKNFTLIVLDMNVTIHKALLNEKIELCAIKHPFNEWNDWHLKENKEKCMDLYWKFEKFVKKIIEEK